MKEYHLTVKEYEHLDPHPDGKYIVKDYAVIYLVNEVIHRLDGPAIEFNNGYKEWCANGKRHRLDGPACEYDGDTEYYINGYRYSTKEEFEIAAYLYKNNLESYK